MTTRLENALRRLEDVLRAQHNPVLDGMQAGLPEDETRELLATAGVDPPPDLISWFDWHNGYVTPPGQPFRGWIAQELQQYPLQVCVDRIYPQVVEGIEIFQEEGVTDPNEDKEWFPLGSVPGAELVINCSSGGQRGYLATWDVHVGGFSANAYRPPTLAEPVEWWAELLEAGIWRYNEATGDIEAEPGYWNNQPELRRRSRMV